MIENSPIWISLLFLTAWMVAIGFFYYSNNKPRIATSLIILWSVFQSILAYTGFYKDALAVPPRFALVLIPLAIMIIYGLLPKQRQWFYRNRNTQISTFLHSIRLPIEVVLLQLFIYKMIPELMTFEGRNFDIVIGISAPIIGLLYFKNRIGKTGLIAWNIVGLFLILFIFFNGVLSGELPFQQFGFDQPNRAVTYFPFILLPAVIVPIVIWTHISDILKLIKE